MKKKFVIPILLMISVLVLISSVYASPINVDYDDGIYHIILSGKSLRKKIQFVSSPNLVTNAEAHKIMNSELTVNAGFFDPKNQKTISYIVYDYQTVEDPLFNDNLMMNPVLRRNLDKIINRTEFRVLDCDGKIKYEITQHNTKTDFMCSVRTSAQGGPQLLPNFRLEEEFFIVKDQDGNVIRESASVLHRVPRTIIGLKTNLSGEQDIHIFIVTNKHPMTLEECREMCLTHNLDSAMAFDGGSSTSLDYKNIHVVSTQDSGDTGRSLKSFLVIKK